MLERVAALRTFARILKKQPPLASVLKSRAAASPKEESAAQEAAAPRSAPHSVPRGESEKAASASKPVVTAEWLAKRHFPPIPLPPALVKATAAVFSKHTHRAVREYGEKLGKAYSIIHSTEKPRNLERMQPFATSTEALEEKVQKHQKTFFDPFMKDFMKLETHGLAKPRSVDDEKELTMKIKYEKQHALGYLYKRNPRTYAAAYRVLSEMQVRLPAFQPTKALDYGAGLGTGMWAAHSLFPSLKLLAGVEPASEMKELGKHLSATVGKMKWFDNIAALPTSAVSEGRFDLVLLSYVLGEVESSRLRALIVEALWHRSTDVFVIIESGTPKGFRLIHSVREWALKKFTREECNIIAPCPHEGNCPLAKDKSSWCHFSVFSAAYPKDVVGMRPGLPNYENEKFAYLVLKKGPTARQKYPSIAEAKTLDEKSFFWDRIVRPVMLPTRYSVIDVCPSKLQSLPLTQTGSIERLRAAKNRDKEAHKFARKAHWGDLWPFDLSKQ